MRFIVSRFVWRRTVQPGVAVAVLVALAGCGGSDAPPVAALSAGQVKARLAENAPGQSAAERRIEREANRVLDGGQDPRATLAARVAELSGTPVVVNLWGEWCVPCKREMPIFQRTALAERGRVAFLGVATSSSRAKTEAYLTTRVALPYPSLLDDQGAVNLGTGVDNVPKTLFYGPDGGKPFVHLGPYESQAQLTADIKRYAS